MTKNINTIMEEDVEQIKKLLAGCIIVVIFIVVGFIFPWGLFFLIPYALHLYAKHLNERNQIKQFLDSELQGMTQKQIRQKRIELLTILQNPFASKTEKDCAKYAIKHIEKNYLKL